MNDPLIVTIATVVLIALSGLFVVIEFALLGARRHRLEELAINSLSARAALRGMNDLTLMLAGAQLGITLCTFALGAVTKPAVDLWLGPVFTAWGLPEWAAGGAAFGFALFLVTFLHLVVGEMAPKSWAIAHPERSALAIGIVSRIYTWPLRPLLRLVNRIANRLVKASGVEPVESAAVGGQDIETIRQLVEHSAKVGTLQPQMQQQISGLIDLGTLPVEALLIPGRCRFTLRGMRRWQMSALQPSSPGTCAFSCWEPRAYNPRWFTYATPCLSQRLGWRMSLHEKLLCLTRKHPSTKRLRACVNRAFSLLWS